MERGSMLKIAVVAALGMIGLAGAADAAVGFASSGSGWRATGVSMIEQARAGGGRSGLHARRAGSALRAQTAVPAYGQGRGSVNAAAVKPGGRPRNGLTSRSTSVPASQSFGSISVGKGNAYAQYVRRPVGRGASSNFNYYNRSLGQGYSFGVPTWIGDSGFGSADDTDVRN